MFFFIPLHKDYVGSLYGLPFVMGDVAIIGQGRDLKPGNMCRDGQKGKSRRGKRALSLDPVSLLEVEGAKVKNNRIR